MENFALLLNGFVIAVRRVYGPHFSLTLNRFSLAVYQNSHAGVNSSSEDVVPELVWGCLSVVCSITA